MIPWKASRMHAVSMSMSHKKKQIHEAWYYGNSGATCMKLLVIAWNLYRHCDRYVLPSQKMDIFARKAPKPRFVTTATKERRFTYPTTGGAHETHIKAEWSEEVHNRCGRSELLRPMCCRCCCSPHQSYNAATAQFLLCLLRYLSCTSSYVRS